MFDFLRKSSSIINIMIILVAVSPAFALGDGNRNLLLIGAMCLSPYFFLRYPVVIPKVDVPLVALCIMMISFPLMFHPETMRWSTVLYSCLFCMYFMAFARVLLAKEYTLSDFAQLLKGLIYAYCVVLIIQQLCVLNEWPIFNVSNYSINEPWKLNSLMSEPSHSARIIPVLMYLYICCQEKLDSNFVVIYNIKQSPMVWAAFIWCVCTMGSTTAFIFLSIILTKMVDRRKLFTSLLVIGSIVTYLFFVSENKSIVRMRKITLATLTLNESKILRADGSGAYRIVPSIRGAKKIGITNFDDWFGHGIDADSKAITPLPGTNTGNAGIFYLWFNYGFPIAVLWWSFSFKICRVKRDNVSLLIWFLCIFMYGGFNNQIIWLVLLSLFTYKNIKYQGNECNS